ncbi:MAG: hypothetical protein AAF754_00295 [Pseudomonadota bacterium]
MKRAFAVLVCVCLPSFALSEITVPLGAYPTDAASKAQYLYRCDALSELTLLDQEAFSSFPAAQDLTFRCMRDRGQFDALLLSASFEVRGLDWTEVLESGDSELMVAVARETFERVAETSAEYTSVLASDTTDAKALISNDLQACAQIPPQ